MCLLSFTSTPSVAALPVIEHKSAMLQQRQTERGVTELDLLASRCYKNCQQMLRIALTVN